MMPAATAAIELVEQPPLSGRGCLQRRTASQFPAARTKPTFRGGAHRVSLAGMRSDDITNDQAWAIVSALRPALE
jgi:hypothetical protein